MKLIELAAYRAFMFAVVPQLYQRAISLPIGVTRLEEAIAEAEYLWDAIDVHVLKVAEKIEND